ncbi:MAG TPA: bifunctional riboflavin kinase/FAD synthetase [Planctomycetota bacterium]|nr:bifunctional riboflavin kinase/FAD synthetase [Planctomycetota bacterium]
MRVYFGNDARPEESHAIVTIGTFDGVHCGHQSVLSTLTAWAKEEASRAGVVTFREHPRKTLAPQQRSPDMVTTLEHRLVLFEREGVAFTWVLDFTPELSKLTAREFAQLYFVERLRLRGLVMGFDSRFGSDRMGKDSPALEPLAQELGFSVRSVPPVLSPDGEIISSTKIREAIVDGRLRDAEAMLGRHVSVYGTVIKGDARGRRLGYHTANIDLGNEVRPPFGVYATVAIVDGALHNSVTNVGYRPTITQNLPPGEKPDLLIETHLFDFSGDLYGRKLEVLFIEKLRDERRFHDVTELVEQIKKDEAKARAILQARTKL